MISVFHYEPLSTTTVADSYLRDQGGILVKMLFHSGLHRCSYRYPQLSNEDRELRKRIFWSAYALDRYLAQSLGIPVSLPDLDIDVCISGRKELHEPTRSDIHGMPKRSNSVEGHANESQDPVDDHPTPTSHTASHNPSEPLGREIVLANFVEYGTFFAHPHSIARLIHGLVPCRQACGTLARHFPRITPVAPSRPAYSFVSPL